MVLIIVLIVSLCYCAYSIYGKIFNRPSISARYLKNADNLQRAYEEATLDDEPTIDEMIDPVTKVVKKKGSFRVYLVQTAQAKFGPLKNTKANRLVVRKFIYDLCIERGLIARHIVQHLDIATALVFVPTKEELVALAIAKTELTRLRNEIRKDLGGDTPGDVE